MMCPKGSADSRNRGMTLGKIQLLMVCLLVACGHFEGMVCCGPGGDSRRGRMALQYIAAMYLGSGGEGQNGSESGGKRDTAL